MEFKKILKYIRYFLFIGALGLFLYGALKPNNDFLAFSIFFMFFNNVLYAFDDISRHIYYLAFHICFFTFLLGGIFSKYITGYKSAYIFTDEIITHTYICLIIALIFLYLSYMLIVKISSTSEQKDDILRYDNKKYLTLRKISRYYFFITYIPWIISTIEKVLFVQRRGYLAYYTSYRSSLPYVLVQIGDTCIIALFIFLATMPRKKEANIPIMLYLAQSVLSVLTGKRNLLVIPIIFVLVYYVMRNRINTGKEKWIKRKHIIAFAILVPFLLSFLYAYKYTRVDIEKENKNLVQSVVGFFEDTSFSVNVISYEKHYEDIIPDKIYSFGSVIDYLRENVITQMFFDFPVYTGQTKERALNAHNFSHTITYLRSSKYYLSGHGYGSSYIAEAYHDMGYFGVILFSCIYGALLSLCYNFKNKSILFVTLSFIAFKSLMIAPRAAASAWLSDIINLNTWAVIILILVLSKVAMKRNMFK